MSMTAGDFCSLYKQPEYASAFDAVTTCFFIDTAPNVIRYIETIRHCLKSGGIWVNIGPLLWHFESSLTPAERKKSKNNTGSKPRHLDSEGIGEPGSFELSNDEVLAWRVMGQVARLCFELGIHQKRGLMRIQNEVDRKNAMMSFWSAYVLDRRWAFGTGLPYAVQDEEIDPQLPLPVRHPHFSNH